MSEHGVCAITGRHRTLHGLRKRLMWSAFRGALSPLISRSMTVEYKVIVDCATGAHYDCASFEEANKTFDRAPAAASGDRLLTVDGVVTRRVYIEVEL